MSDNQSLTDHLPFDMFIRDLDDGIMVMEGKEVLYLNKKSSKFFLNNTKIKLPCSLDKLFTNEQTIQINDFIGRLKQNKEVKRQVFDSFSDFPLDVSLSKLNHHNKQFILFTFCKCAYIKPEVHKNNDLYSDFFPFILLETDARGKILNYNYQLEQQLLYSDKDVQHGLYLTDIVSRGNEPIVSSLLNNFSKFESSERIELKLRKKFGETLPALMYFKGINKKEKFNGVRCLLLDISETKQIEYKYKQNQQRLRKVLDLVPHMIFLKDFNGNILLANKASASFYNTTTKNLVYGNIADFHKSKTELERIVTEDKEVITTKEKQVAKISEVTDLDKITHIFESTKVPFTDPVSGQVHSLGIFMDITDKKRVEEEIKETKEKYRLLVERGSDGILILQDELIVFANKQAARIFGYPIEEFTGKPMRSFISRAQLRKTIAEYSQNAQSKNVDNHYELKINKPDGDIVYVEAKLNTINYESKKSRLVFIRDITKRKIAEKRSERDKNMLEQAQKIASLGSWEWDIQKSTLFCSNEIYQILEVEDDQLTKKSPRWLVQFIPNIEKNKIFKGFVESIKTAERLDIEFPIISSTGSRKIVHSQSQVYKDLTGKPERVIGTWLDISERIRFEQILKEAKLKAEESDKLKSAFLANMSHEIRTPMNAILGFANLLKRNQLKTEVKKEYIDHILQSGEGLLKLINDIVDISKIESNQLNIENGQVHINEMLDQLYNRYEELLLLKNRVDIKLIIEKALPDPNFMVVADAFRLQQVLSNLINNSIKFTYDGTIQFGYKIANSELQFFVEDEGVGVPFEKKDIIFKRFGKLDDPEKMNKSGTGLGLSISKSLVNLMGGKIWLDSGLAGCTRFCFTIPLKISNLDESKIQKNKFPIKNVELNLKNKTILIAEDEVLNYKLLETLLQKTGANVMWAKNGIEAVEIVNANQVDLIFMDIKMPQMNGYEATKAIKNIDKNIPIIAQTAFAFSNERKYILQSGCDMYLTKPINHNEIFEVLNKYLT